MYSETEQRILDLQKKISDGTSQTKQRLTPKLLEIAESIVLRKSEALKTRAVAEYLADRIISVTHWCLNVDQCNPELIDRELHIKRFMREHYKGD